MRDRLERNPFATKPPPAGDEPTPQDVRTVLDRIVDSDLFRASPQLVAFLRFVVEAALRGESERIKGYTIAVEALGRGERFDPQSDPIVRVEATRLRRAMDAYYVGPGAKDPIIIELPRGSYVPAFRRRAVRRRTLRSALAALPRPGAASPWPAVALAAAIVLTGFALFAFLQFGKGPAGTREAAVEVLPPGNGLPNLLVQRIAVTGSPDADAISAMSLFEKIRDAFARFDGVDIISDAPTAPDSSMPASPESKADYRLAGVVEHRADHTTTVRVSLQDIADGTTFWSKTFDGISRSRDRSATEDAIVSELATTLLQPFGVLRAHARVKQLTGSGDPRYRCVIEASESLRSFELEQHERARACLLRLTVLDPGFVTGMRYLAAIYLREYLFGLGARPINPAMLDSAFQVARRAQELQPESSRGFNTLASVHLARGEVGRAFETSERAVALNRYDLAALSDYGGRLVWSGEVDRGLDVLRAAGAGVVLPATHHFHLFLGNYLKGDAAAAAHEADQIIGDSYSLGLIARALTANAAGNGDRTRAALDRLVALRPAWRTDPRGELRRFFPAPAIVDRLAGDLAAAGLH